MMAMQLLAALLLLTASCAQAAEEVQLPRSVKICHRDQPDYASCLRLAIQESWLTFVKGIPEMDLPVLDPMYVDRFENTYHAGEVMGKFVLKDVRTYGMAKTNFLAVRPQFEGDKMNMEVDIEIPKIFIDGDCKAEGQIGMYKIGGKGYFNVSMEGITATWGLEGRVENDRWVIEHFHVYPDVESMKVYFTDLFNGNRDLNKAAMEFVNEYWPVLYKGMLPTVAAHWDYHLSDFANRLVFSKLPVSKVFP